VTISSSRAETTSSLCAHSIVVERNQERVDGVSKRTGYNIWNYRGKGVTEKIT